MGKKKKPFVSDWNWHHRLAKKNKGSGNIDGGNMSHVPVDKHRAFHLLFDTKSVPDIARILNEVWIDPAYVLIAVKREKEPCKENSLPSVTSAEAKPPA